MIAAGGSIVKTFEKIIFLEILNFACGTLVP